MLLNRAGYQISRAALVNSADSADSADSACGRRAARRTVTIGRRAGERKASGSRHIRIVFQTRPSLPRSALRLFLLVPRERAFPRAGSLDAFLVEPRDGREDSCPPREKSASSSCGFRAHGCRIAVVRFSFSPSPSRTVSLSFFAVLFPSASPFPSVCLLSLLRVVIPFAKLLAPGRGGEVKASALSIVN